MMKLFHLNTEVTVKFDRNYFVSNRNMSLHNALWDFFNVTNTSDSCVCRMTDIHNSTEAFQYKTFENEEPDENNLHL